MTCIICRFPVEPDDIAIGSPSGRVICLRCYARETGNEHPVPKGLRREMEAELGKLDAQSKWGIG